MMARDHTNDFLIGNTHRLSTFELICCALILAVSLTAAGLAAYGIASSVSAGVGTETQVVFVTNHSLAPTLVFCNLDLLRVPVINFCGLLGELVIGPSQNFTRSYGSENPSVSSLPGGRCRDQLPAANSAIFTVHPVDPQCIIINDPSAFLFPASGRSAMYLKFEERSLSLTIFNDSATAARVSPRNSRFAQDARLLLQSGGVFTIAESRFVPLATPSVPQTRFELSSWGALPLEINGGSTSVGERGVSTTHSLDRADFSATVTVVLLWKSDEVTVVRQYQQVSNETLAGLLIGLLSMLLEALFALVFVAARRVNAERKAAIAIGRVDPYSASKTANFPVEAN